MALPHAGLSSSTLFGQKLECDFLIPSPDSVQTIRINIVRAVTVHASEQFSQRVGRSSQRSRFGGEISLYDNDNLDTLAYLFDEETAGGTDTPEPSSAKAVERARHARIGAPVGPASRSIQKKIVAKRFKPRPPLSKEGQEGRLLEQTEARQLRNGARQRAAEVTAEGGARGKPAFGGKEGSHVVGPEHLHEERAAKPVVDKRVGKLNRREWEDLALKRLRQQRLRKMEMVKESAAKEDSRDSRQATALQAKEDKAATKSLGREIELAKQAALLVRPKVTVRRITGSTAELASTVVDSSAIVEERSDLSEASVPEDLEATECSFLESHRELFDDLGLNVKERAVASYLLSLGFGKADFRRLADKRLQAFLTNLHAAKARVAYLRSLGVKAAALPKVLVRHPQLLEYSIERTMQPRVEYLVSLGLQRSQLGRIITLAPTLLQHSVEDGLKPRVRFLQEVVGISDSDMPLVVQRSPQILTQSIENSLQPKLHFLQSLGVDFEGLARMVTRHPQLLHYSVQDSMQPRVEFLRSIGMSGPDIVRTIVRLSQILSLSVEANLAPKYEYLTTHLGGDANTVLRFPAFFTLSLEQRIKPRHQFLQSTQRRREGPFPMKLLTYTDQEFCRVVQCSVQEYEAFKNDLLLNSLAKKFGNVKLGSKMKKSQARLEGIAGT